MAAAELSCHEFHISSFSTSDGSPFTVFHVCSSVKDVSVMENLTVLLAASPHNTPAVAIMVLLSASFVVASL